MSTDKHDKGGQGGNGRAELLEVFPGRPATVIHDGWTVYVAVRDRAYLTTLKAFKRMLRDAHPDKNGGNGGAAFRKIHLQRLKWQNAEAQWYGRLGLLPPDGYKQAVMAMRARSLRLKGKGGEE